MENRGEQNECKFRPSALTPVYQMWGIAEYKDATRREDVFTSSVQRHDWLPNPLARVASDIA